MLPIAATAQLPLMKGVRLEMLEAINESGKSNYRLFILLHRVLEMIRPINAITIEAFKKNSSVFLELIHVIPTEVRNSLVLGTLAYDFYDAQKRPYSGEHPGVYAIGITIHGRGGAFLTNLEFDHLAGGIKRYCDASAHWRRHGGNMDNMTQAEVADIQYAFAVDDVFRGSDRTTGPRFLDDDLSFDRARLHIAWLRRRANSTRLLDPAGSVVQIQSPIYVGFSSDFMDCGIISHDPRNGLEHSNNLLALMMSCIKHCLGLQPWTVGVPVIPTWTPEQLPAAEQLVIALASSMHEQGGLNAVPSTNRGGTTNPGAEDHVLGERTFMYEAMGETLKEYDYIRRLNDHMTEFLQLDESCQQGERAARAALDNYRHTLARYQGAYTKVRADLKRAEEDEARMLKEMMLMRKARRLLRALNERARNSIESDGNASRDVPRNPSSSETLDAEESL